MYRLILQRLASIVGILLVVTIGTFVLIKLSPIDPVAMKFNLVGATPDPVLVEQMREQLGLKRPVVDRQICTLAGPTGDEATLVNLYCIRYR